jgi:hypothetical protein
MVEKRAADVINGFAVPRRMNAVDAMSVLIELKRSTDAFRRLENAFNESILIQELLKKEIQDLKDKESRLYSPNPSFNFEDLLKPKGE